MPHRPTCSGSPRNGAATRPASRRKPTREPFQPLPPALLRVHRQLKAQLDPHAIFNPGRLYADF